jgi:hypothetical protein
MSAAGAAGAVVALSDCTSAQSYAGYGGVCVPDACGGYVEQETGADTTVIVAEASVGSPDADDASSATDTSEPDASDGGESDAAKDAPSDAPDGG